MTDIIIPAPVAQAIATHEAERIRGYLENRRAANTQRTYASAWKDFAAWCAWKEHAALPASPQTVSKTHTFPAHTLSPVVTMLSSSHAPDVVRNRAQCSLSLMTFSPATCCQACDVA